MNKRNYNPLGGGYTGESTILDGFNGSKGTAPTKPNIQNALIKPKQENNKLKKDNKNDNN